MLEISGSHSNFISDNYVFHYGNELVSRTGNKEIRHFVTTNYDQKLQIGRLTPIPVLYFTYAINYIVSHKKGANLFLSVTLSFRNEWYRQNEFHPPYLISVDTYTL